MINSHWHCLSNLLSLPCCFFRTDSYQYRRPRSVSCSIVQVGQGETRSFDEVAYYLVLQRVLQQKVSLFIELLVVRMDLLINLAHLAHHLARFLSYFEATQSLLFEWKVLTELVL